MTRDPSESLTLAELETIMNAQFERREAGTIRIIVRALESYKADVLRVARGQREAPVVEET